MSRKVYTLKDLPREIAEQIMQSKVDPKHDHLNELLDDPIQPSINNIDSDELEEIGILSTDNGTVDYE